MIADGRIVGAILLGYSREVAAVRTAVKRGYDVARLIAALRAGRWDGLADLSGERPLLAAADTGGARQARRRCAPRGRARQELMQ